MNTGQKSAERSCPKCGAALSGESLSGLCRRCLGRLGFGFLTGDGSNGAGAKAGPHRFGDYELLEEIARGGMGVVYKARQVSLNRVVAVKMVLHGPFSSEEFIQRFRTEAQAAAGLHHPNIVAIYEVGHHDGQHYFSMEYIEGKNLAQFIADFGFRISDFGRAARYVKTIAEAIHYAHQQGVLHRDLKPSNVLLDIFDQPRITDFGLAKLMTSDSQLTVTGQALGSPGHMPPEQAAGKHAAGPQGDVYSLGAILYHLVTGRPPFQGETIQEVLLQAQNSEPVTPRRLNPGVPLDLQTICLKCLEKEPARRYPTAGALAEDLERFLANEPILARPVSPAQRLRLWGRRRPVTAALSAALTLAVIAGLAGVILEWRRAERHAQGETVHRRLAEGYAAKSRLNLYAADISLASQALQRGDYGLAHRTLAGLRPNSGEPDLRGFEWRFLWNLCQGDQLATLTGHTWIVTCVAFSTDGRFLASGSQDGLVKIWETSRNELVTTLTGEAGSVWSVGFSADGGLLMTAASRGVTLWNTDNWQVAMRFPGEMASLSRTDSVIAISESSPFSWERAGKVSLWNYRTGTKLLELNRPGRVPALSPDGRLLAVGGLDHNVELWELPSGKLLRELPTAAPVWSLTFSPGGERLVSAGWANNALVWELSGAGPPKELAGHLRTVWASAFSPDGHIIFTSSSDQTLRAWDAANFLPGDIFRGHDNEVWCIAVSPDSRRLATGGKDQTVRLWPSELPKKETSLPSQRGNRPLFSPDGTRMLVLGASAGGPCSQLWNVAGHTLIMELPAGRALGFTRDGEQLLYLGEANGALERWSLKDRLLRASLNLSGIVPSETGFVHPTLSPEGAILAALAEDGQIRFWDTATGELLWSVKGPSPPIRAVALSSGGKYLAVSLERENEIRLYERPTRRLSRLGGHRDFVSGLAFSPDGLNLASGSMDGSIRLWDLATEAEIDVLPGHMEEVTDVAFSPDGNTLASVGHRDAVKLWHVPTHRELVSLDMPQAGVFLEFSPDGRRLAVTTEQNTVRLFDAPTAAPKP